MQSLTPLLTAVLGAVLLDEALRLRQWIGSALGTIGVGLVAGHAAFESASRLEGLILAFVGVLGLVGGTLYFGRFCRNVPLLPSATAQFVSAAAASMLGALLLEAPPSRPRSRGCTESKRALAAVAFWYPYAQQGLWPIVASPQLLPQLFRPSMVHLAATE